MKAGVTHRGKLESLVWDMSTVKIILLELLKNEMAALHCGRAPAAHRGTGPGWCFPRGVVSVLLPYCIAQYGGDVELVFLQCQCFIAVCKFLKDGVGSCSPLHHSGYKQFFSLSLS